MSSYEYAHVDVFTCRRLEGNGLAVVFCPEAFPAPVTMLEIAREFKQFETIFVSDVADGAVEARIFTVDGELPFAGHPLLGAAAALHARLRPQEAEMPLLFRLCAKAVPTVSQRTPEGFHVRMRQGAPLFLEEVRRADYAMLAEAHNLTPADLDPRLPIEVVSTGLPYALIPVRGCLGRARITIRDLEERLAGYGASYSYLFDSETLEARTWDNLGLVEDSATGSAAGPLAAYLCRHGLLKEKQTVLIRQGRYANRPGELHAWMEDGEAYVSGGVVSFARGSFTL